MWRRMANLVAMQRDGELRIEHELRIAYQKIIAFTAKTTDSFALIQVLNELIQALPGNIAAQDAYRLGVFLLEYYAEFEDADA